MIFVFNIYISFVLFLFCILCWLTSIQLLLTGVLFKFIQKFILCRLWFCWTFLKAILLNSLFEIWSNSSLECITLELVIFSRNHAVLVFQVSFYVSALAFRLSELSVGFLLFHVTHILSFGISVMFKSESAVVLLTRGKSVNKPQLCLGYYAWLPAVLREQRTNCRTVTTRRWKYSTGNNNHHCLNSSNWRGRKGTRILQCEPQYLFPLGRNGEEMSREHDWSTRAPETENTQ